MRAVVWVLYIMVVIFQAVDAWQTYLLLGLGAYEVAPIRLAIEAAGFMPAMILCKGIPTAALGVFLYVVCKGMPQTGGAP